MSLILLTNKGHVSHHVTDTIMIKKVIINNNYHVSTEQQIAIFDNHTNIVQRIQDSSQKDVLYSSTRLSCDENVKITTIN